MLRGDLFLYTQGIHFSVDHSPRPNDDLCLLSNDIPIPTTNSSESLSDLDVEDTVIIGESKGITKTSRLNSIGKKEFILFEITVNQLLFGTKLFCNIIYH